MNDPGYDFFAIGGPDDPAKVPPPEGQPPIVPSPVPPVVGATYHSPPPARTFQMGTMTVNQFGTPVELPAVPTGPYAAPGMGTAPAPVPGLVTTWQGPQASGRARAGRSPHRHGTPRDELPRNVRAVALLGSFFGAPLAFDLDVQSTSRGTPTSRTSSTPQRLPEAGLVRSSTQVLPLVLLRGSADPGLLLGVPPASAAVRPSLAALGRLDARGGVRDLPARQVVGRCVHDGYQPLLGPRPSPWSWCCCRYCVTGDGRRWLMNES